MKIAVAADHAGYPEKEQLKPLLTSLAFSTEISALRLRSPLIIPTTRARSAKRLHAAKVDQVLLFCGLGTGIAIAANKVPGVRAWFAANFDRWPAYTASGKNRLDRKGIVGKVF
jgi:ribose 5-phosphate isomerase B